MKKVTKNCLQFDVPVLFYNDFAEADQAAGRVGAAAEEMNNNLYYRGAAVEARGLVCEAVEAATGVKRETVPVMDEYEENGEKKKRQAKDKSGNPATEFVLAESPYVKLALEKSGKTVEQLQPAVTDYILKALARDVKEGEKVPEGIAVDIKRTEREPAKPKTLPEKFKTAAETVIKNNKVDKITKDFKARLKVDADVLVDGKVDVTKLGWHIKELTDAIAAETLAKAIGG